MRSWGGKVEGAEVEVGSERGLKDELAGEEREVESL